MSDRFASSPRQVFIDSGAFLALANPRETRRPAALAIARRIETERWRASTSNFVVAETHALVLARLGRAAAARVLRETDRDPRRPIVRVEEADERRAREIIDRYVDKDFSLTDAISFAVMERLGIGYAFSFDRHFAQYGFAVLTADDPR